MHGLPKEPGSSACGAMGSSVSSIELQRGISYTQQGNSPLIYIRNIQSGKYLVRVGGAWAFVHMPVVLPPKTPSPRISGAAFSARPFAGNKSPALWGFLRAGAAARGSAAAGEGQEASFKKHPAAKANHLAGLLKSEGLLEKRMRQEYVLFLRWERAFFPYLLSQG